MLSTGLKRTILISVTSIYVVAITVLSLVKLKVKIEPDTFLLFDKFVHFCFYLVLNLLLLAVFRCKSASGMLCVTLFSVLYGLAIEVVQNYVGRSFDLNDILANSLGAISALVVFIAWRR